MNEAEIVCLNRARTILSRVAGLYPDLLVVRMLNNALLFASAKLDVPLEYELDVAGGCRCYGMEAAFDQLEEAAEFVRDERTGVMRPTDTLTDPGEELAVVAAVGFPYMLEAMGKRPEIPGDDELVRMFNELVAMLLTVRSRREEKREDAAVEDDKAAIMDEYDIYHSGPRVERAAEMCERMLAALRHWRV